MTKQSALVRLIPPINFRQGVAFRYTTAVLASLVFIALRWLLGQFIGFDAPFAVLFVPIAFSAFYGGLGPGLVSVLTALSLADYFLVPPLYTIGLPNANWVVASFLFAVSGMVVSVLGELGRKAVLQAADEAEIRKVAQSHALVNEERLRVAEEVMAGGVWDWDIPSHHVFWSDGYRRLFDYPMNEAPSREKWLQSLHPDDRQRVLDFVDDQLRQKRHHSTVEYRIRTASGRIRWISSYGRVFYDGAGKPLRMVGINLDITSRHLAEETARNNETKMRLLMQYARVADFEWNPRDGSIVCSREFYEVVGLDPSVPPTFDAFVKFVHPSDRERIENLLSHLPGNRGRTLISKATWLALTE